MTQKLNWHATYVIDFTQEQLDEINKKHRSKYQVKTSKNRITREFSTKQDAIDFLFNRLATLSDEQIKKSFANVIYNRIDAIAHYLNLNDVIAYKNRINKQF